MVLAETLRARLWDLWGKALPLRALNSIVAKPAETVAVHKPQCRVQNEGAGKFLPKANAAQGFSYIHKLQGFREKPLRVRSHGWLLASVSICPKTACKGKRLSPHMS